MADEQNTTAVVDQPAQGVDPIGGEPYITADQAAEQDHPEETVEGAEQVTEGADSANDEAIAKLAEEEGLDLNDPSQRDMAERMYKREAKSREQAADTGEEQDVLTPFEKSLIEKGDEIEAESQQQTFQQQQERPQQQADPLSGFPQIRDRGLKWQGWEDAYADELAALGKIGQDMEANRKPDLRDLMEIRAAQTRRSMLEQMPYLDRFFQQRIGQALEPLMPQINQMSEIRITENARNAAIADLSSTPGFEIIRELQKPTDDKLLKFTDPDTGETSMFPNTPLNKVLVRNPEILKIHVPHKDPEISRRLTMTAAYKMAVKTYRAGVVKPTTAQALVQTGVKVAEKRAADRTRQALNAGSGATTRGGNSQNGDPFAGIQPSKFGSLFNK